MSHMVQPSPLPFSTFHGRLVSVNRLGEQGFDRWVFLRGMLFGSWEKWWGGGGKRVTQHEGLDLHFYRTAEGSIHHLGDNTRVPVIFEGRVVRIIGDFLGQSIFVLHEEVAQGRNHLYTIYGHTKLRTNIKVGSALEEGEIFGVIAAARNSGHLVPSHLHISVAWVPDTLPHEELDWSVTADRMRVILVDPLIVIRCPYVVTERL